MLKRRKWSSTSGKDDDEGDDVNKEEQINNVLAQQVEAQHEVQVSIEVGESVLEGDHGRNNPIIENEVQIISRPALVQQQTSYIHKKIQDSSPHYDELRTRTPRISVTTP